MDKTIKSDIIKVNTLLDDIENRDSTNIKLDEADAVLLNKIKEYLVIGDLDTYQTYLLLYKLLNILPKFIKDK